MFIIRFGHTGIVAHSADGKSRLRIALPRYVRKRYYPGMPGCSLLRPRCPILPGIMRF
jgi:hypothetical protein